MRLIASLLVFAALSVGCSVEAASEVSTSLDEVEADQAAPVLVDRVALLSADARDALDASPHALLLPDDPTLLASTVVMSGPHFVAWAARDDGVAIALHGTDFRWTVGNDAPPPPPTDQVRGQLAEVSQNEGIRTATWDEGGFAWALDVECEDVYHDARCADDAYVRALAERLAFVGGAR